MKKIFMFLMFIFVIAIIALFAFVLNKSSEVLLIDGAIIPSNLCAQIPEVIVIHREGCSACAIALPRLEELEQELEMEFKYYDSSIIEDAQEIRDKGLIPQYVPTVIINCKVFIGALSKEQYKSLILAE